MNPAYIENPPTATPSPSASVEPTATPSPDPAGDCQVRYAVPGEWTGGFQGAVTITNSGATPIQGWQLAWTFPAGQQVTQLWNGDYTQSGATVTVSNAGWNGTIAGGGSVDFGYLGSWTGSNPAPTAFTLNGTACNVT